MCAAFSSQPLNSSGLLATFNLFWTSLPIIAYAVTEQVGGWVDKFACVLCVFVSVCVCVYECECVC
jgi:hypothetical protein